MMIVDNDDADSDYNDSYDGKKRKKDKSLKKEKHRYNIWWYCRIRRGEESI